MKCFLILWLEFWFMQGTFFKTIHEENDSQYWKTRYLSGSDYGMTYNLNRLKIKSSNDENLFRPVFNWNTGRNIESRRDENHVLVSNEMNLVSSSAQNDEKNQSNVWWPWSNYEEWALSRKHDHLNNPTISEQSTTSNFNLTNQEKKKKKKKRKRKPKRRKQQKNTTLSWNGNKEMFFLSENSNKIDTLDHETTKKNSSRHPKWKNTDQGVNYRGLNKNDIDMKNQSLPSSDNNEMDNEINPRYNYYNSIPLMNYKTNLVDRMWKDETLGHFFRSYSKRNFTDDSNECLINNGGCEGLCVNTPGSYKCHCPSGFKVDINKCIDVNECLLRNGHGPCQDKCTNMWGSYKCSCENILGTRLASDGHTCEDIDECREQTAGCSHECINTVGSAFCLCPKGFMLGLDWKTCYDINECQMHEFQETKCENGCKNTEGSYICL